MINSGKKTNLKGMMREIGVSMQQVADYSGVSKADVSRVMNEDMEILVMDTVYKLLKEKNMEHNKILADCE
jgi:transcriptional regulator with XRE-family HTH domain